MPQTSYSYTRLALQKFKKNFWGVLSFYFIIFISVVSLTAYFYIPDYTANANTGDLALHSKQPGFSVDYIQLPDDYKRSFSEYWTGRKEPLKQIAISTYYVQNDILFYKTYSDRPDLEDYKQLSLHSFKTENINEIVRTKNFWLGTDNQGRDYLSRLLIGSRVSLSIGFVAVLISLVIGISLGAIAGYYGGKIDTCILWLINVFWSIPTLLLVIAITLALGKGFWQVFIAVGLTMWVEVARVVRGQVISTKEQQYITAARALGYNDYRIITKHILPNCMAPVIVISAANFASAILMESGLSFLGLGTQVPTPSWGAMIKENYNYILLGKPYLALLPGFAMFLLVVSFMLIGNALRDALDVKQ
ncbi:ABC transporter permease [Myroides pelagicus]|uniref:ABC transporter permease subunit n=1 Tax=Myroides pelagicus TaxID=270914 RepID=A0A7K1GJX4_9FLAO|nr:ABC transporter permease [Myroides pelagicus]MEC4112558.1 ABC transporter permease [Myroides pelagicus]MTH28524.1 ABC transporter permease subunit [Myroides pelagicus]